MRNIAAFTPVPSGSEYYPSYISINRVTDDPLADVEITVRGQEKEPGVCGPEAKIVLSRENFVTLMTEAAKRATADGQ